MYTPLPANGLAMPTRQPAAGALYVDLGVANKNPDALTEFPNAFPIMPEVGGYCGGSIGVNSNADANAGLTAFYRAQIQLAAAYAGSDTNLNFVIFSREKILPASVKEAKIFALETTGKETPKWQMGWNTTVKPRDTKAVSVINTAITDNTGTPYYAVSGGFNGLDPKALIEARHPATTTAHVIKSAAS